MDNTRLGTLLTALRSLGRMNDILGLPEKSKRTARGEVRAALDLPFDEQIEAAWRATRGAIKALKPPRSDRLTTAEVAVMVGLQLGGVRQRLKVYRTDPKVLKMEPVPFRAAANGPKRGPPIFVYVRDPVHTWWFGAAATSVSEARAAAGEASGRARRRAAIRPTFAENMQMHAEVFASGLESVTRHPLPWIVLVDGRIADSALIPALDENAIRAVLQQGAEIIFMSLEEAANRPWSIASAEAGTKQEWVSFYADLLRDASDRAFQRVAHDVAGQRGPELAAWPATAGKGKGRDRS